MDNWSSHLRNYRKETDNPKSRVSSRRGFDAYINNDKASDSGGYSLYSETTSEDTVAAATKDLNRCARLLNDMLSNDQETTNMLLSERSGASKGIAKKKVQAKPKEKRLKGILTKKTTSKGVPKKQKNQQGKRQVKKALFSDTDSSMKSSVLAPPLNNSDAIKQAAVTTGRIVNPDLVLVTAMPATTRPPQRANMNERPVSPFRTADAAAVQAQQTNRPLFNTRIPSSTPAVVTPSKCEKHNHGPNKVAKGTPFLTEVNPQELANRLHGIPPSIENQQCQGHHESCYFHDDYSQEMYQQYPQRLDRSTNPHECHSENFVSTGGPVGHPNQRTLLNTPPEKLRSRNMDSAQKDRKVPKKEKPANSKKSKEIKKRLVDKGTDMTVVEDVMHSETEENDEESDENTLVESQSSVYVETDPRLHHPRLSPVSRKARLRTLRYLFNELRSCSGTADDETERLLNEIEDNLLVLVPNVNTMNTEHGIEVSLAMQPLRSENANLRRKLRLLEQQTRHRDLDSDDETPKKPDQDFNVIHLQMLNHALENQLREERTSREMLQQQLKTVTIDVDKLSKEKSEMLEVLSHKDNTHIKSQQDWIEEAGQLRSELQSLEHDREDYRRRASAAVHEKEILTITLKEREKEVDRLQDLVSTFRGSMRKLLEDLSKSGPNYENAGIMDHLNQTLQLGASPRKVWHPVDLTPIRESDIFERFPQQQSSSGLTSEALKSHNANQDIRQTSNIFHRPEGATEPKIVEPLSQPESFPSNNKSPGTDYGLGISDTDYLGSPDIRARQILSDKPASSRDSTGFIDLAASTVKGILGPFADRMRNLSPEKHELTSLSSSEIDDFSSAEEQVTLVETDNKVESEELTTVSTITESSRYSVTDYFEKYPQSRGKKTDQKTTENADVGSHDEKIRSDPKAEYTTAYGAPEKSKQPFHTAPTETVTPASNIRHSNDNRSTASTPQSQLYKGTELDTSLSTIREKEDVMSVISSAVTSSSVTSIDDRDFRHGLANLDANIARIQASLKQVMQK